MDLDDIKKAINKSNKEIYSLVKVFLKEREEKIMGLPKTAFLCLYKEDHIYDSREFFEIYKNRLIKIGYEYNSSKTIYLDCEKLDIVYYNRQKVKLTSLIWCLTEQLYLFDIDEMIKKYDKISSLPLDQKAILVTKTRRNDEELTAKNFLFLILDRNQRCTFKITCEDFMKYVHNAPEFAKYVNKDTWDELQKEYVVRNATKLLKGK